MLLVVADIQLLPVELLRSRLNAVDLWLLVVDLKMHLRLGLLPLNLCL